MQCMQTTYTYYDEYSVGGGGGSCWRKHTRRVPYGNKTGQGLGMG